MPQEIARRFIVQGVGIRYFVQKTAAELGLKGYTANLDDGRVEVSAIGGEAALDDLAGRRRIGPRLPTSAEWMRRNPQWRR